MGRLLKHELYKLLKSKGLLILFIVVAASTLITVATLSAMVGFAADAGAVPGASELNYMRDLVGDEMGNMLFYIGIIAAILVINEFSRGTIKLAASADVNRLQLYFAKFVSVSVATMLLVIMQRVILFTGFDIILRTPVFWHFANTLDNLFMLLLLCVSLCSFTNFFAFLTRSTAGLIAVMLGLTFVFYIASVAAIFSTSPLLSFVNRYSYITVLSSYNQTASTHNLINYFVCVFLNLIPFFGAGFWVFGRQEIK